MLQSVAYDLQKQPLPDGVLVELSLAGDQAAFESLVNRYQYQIANYIWRLLKDQDQVHDILQHVYLRLYLSLPTLLRGVSLKAWLFQVAHHRCLDELRKRGRRPEVCFSIIEWQDGDDGMSPLEAIVDHEPLPEEIIESSEQRAALQRVLNALPPKFRSVVLMHCFRQLTFGEIGRALNMPESTVKTYFYRALPRLRKALAANEH